DGSNVVNGFDPVPGPVAPPIDVPPQAPIGLPPIDARAPFDPKVLFRGVREAVGDHGVDGAPEGPWSRMAVDEPPVLLAGPSPGCHRFVMGAPLAGGGQSAVFHKGLPDRALEGENPCLTISSSPSARRTASGCSAWARCRSWFTPS